MMGFFDSAAARLRPLVCAFVPLANFDEVSFAALLTAARATIAFRGGLHHDIEKPMMTDTPKEEGAERDHQGS